MRKIIYTMPDGGLAVVHTVRNTVGETLTTDAEIEQRAWNRLPTEAINPVFVDASDIPTDRTFRDAWKADGSKVTHDMDKCRAIHTDRLRTLRAPKLAALDVAYQRADEGGDHEGKASITARKQALRDVTKDAAILSAKTPEELASVMPEILK